MMKLCMILIVYVVFRNVGLLLCLFCMIEGFSFMLLNMFSLIRKLEISVISLKLFGFSKCVSIRFEVRCMICLFLKFVID